MTLPSMEAPHQQIHATADEALRRADCGDTDGALELIASRRNRELAALIRRFEESRRILTEGHRELAIVLSRGNGSLAFSADLAEAVEPIPEENIEALPVGLAQASTRNGVAGRAAIKEPANPSDSRRGLSFQRGRLSARYGNRPTASALRSASNRLEKPPAAELLWQSFCSAWF